MEIKILEQNEIKEKEKKKKLKAVKICLRKRKCAKEKRENFKKERKVMQESKHD